jgi:5-dehydro-2-deoxygluconokinase
LLTQISAPDVRGDVDTPLLPAGARSSALVVKRGAHGARICLPDGQRIDVPGFPVEIYNILVQGMPLRLALFMIFA